MVTLNEQEVVEGKIRSIYLLNPQQVQHYQPEILEELKRTRIYEFWTPEQVVGRLLNGAMQAWALSDGEIRLILLTDIITYASGLKSFRFVGAVGRDLEEFLPIAASCFKKVVRQLGCHNVEVIGRRGWERRLKDLGFERHYTVFVKALDRPEKEN